MIKFQNSGKIKFVIKLVSNYFYYIQDKFLTYYFQLTILFKKIDETNYSLTIVTAADSSHFKSALQLINSILNYEPQSKIIFYDLGLKENEKKVLLDSKIKYKTFNFDSHPNFYRLEQKDAGAYAWKPAIIYEEMLIESGLLIWMDAGNKVIKNLKSLKYAIILNGFFSPLSSGNVQRWTHESTLEKLLVSKNIIKKRNLNAALIGINTHNNKIKNLIEIWYTNSKNKDLILPEGAGKHNHRWDQSLLTLEYYKQVNKYFFPRTNKLFGVLIHQDID